MPRSVRFGAWLLRLPPRLEIEKATEERAWGCRLQLFFAIWGLCRRNFFTDFSRQSFTYFSWISPRHSYGFTDFSSYFCRIFRIFSRIFRVFLRILCVRGKHHFESPMSKSIRGCLDPNSRMCDFETRIFHSLTMGVTVYGLYCLCRGYAAYGRLIPSKIQGTRHECELVELLAAMAAVSAHSCSQHVFPRLVGTHATQHCICGLGLDVKPCKW